jgi:ribosomal protein L37E
MTPRWVNQGKGNKIGQERMADCERWRDMTACRRCGDKTYQGSYRSSIGR